MKIPKQMMKLTLTKTISSWVSIPIFPYKTAISSHLFNLIIHAYPPKCYFDNIRGVCESVYCMYMIKDRTMQKIKGYTALNCEDTKIHITSFRVTEV